MKWINHQTTTFCVTMAAVPDPIMAAMAAVSSSLPDAIESTRGGFRYATHRGVSHDIVFWVPVLFGLLLVTHWPGLLPTLPICQSIPQMISIAVAVGVGMHLLMDGMSKGGIPVAGGGRINLNLYKTFTLSEYAVAGLICVLSLGIAWRLGHLSRSVWELGKYVCW